MTLRAMRLDIEARRCENGAAVSTRRPARRSIRRIALDASVFVLVVMSLGVAGPAASGRAASAAGAVPEITSGNGISVLDVTAVDERALDVRLQTPLVSDFPTIGGNGVRIVLPDGYDPSSPRRYPVLYLLHGATSSYKTWYQDSTADILRHAGSDLIVVMPDGGKVGMYTDWIDQSEHRQGWMTYHLDQLVPFIDRNLKTIDDRGARAIAGVSMGGLGAFRYTAARPDLFGAAASFSGLLNPHAPLAVASLPVMNAYWQLPAFGQYGLPFWPFWGAWRAGNPVGQAAKFQGVTTMMFVGQGTDPAELEIRGEAETMSAALTRAGVPHRFVNYGAPGGSCNGGHSPGCAGYAFDLAMPQIRDALGLPAVR